MPDRTPEIMPDRMLGYMPYILPDGMSETMSVRIVCQSGDNSKKVILHF